MSESLLEVIRRRFPDDDVMDWLDLPGVQEALKKDKELKLFPQVQVHRGSRMAAFHRDPKRVCYHLASSWKSVSQSYVDTFGEAESMEIVLDIAAEFLDRERAVPFADTRAWALTELRAAVLKDFPQDGAFELEDRPAGNFRVLVRGALRVVEVRFDATTNELTVSNLTANTIPVMMSDHVYAHRNDARDRVLSFLHRVPFLGTLE